MPCGHGTLFHANKAKRYVNTVICPFVSKKLYNLYPLLKMKILTEMPQTYMFFIKIVSLFSVNSCRYISCYIKSRTIRLCYKRRRKAVLIQFYNLCSVILYEQSGFPLSFIERISASCRNKNFRRYMNQSYTQHLVYPVEFLKAFVSEPLPKLNFLRLALFKSCEYSSGFIL